MSSCSSQTPHQLFSQNTEINFLFLIDLKVKQFDTFLQVNPSEKVDETFSVAGIIAEQVLHAKQILQAAAWLKEKCHVGIIAVTIDQKVKIGIIAKFLCCCHNNNNKEIWHLM